MKKATKHVTNAGCLSLIVFVLLCLKQHMCDVAVPHAYVQPFLTLRPRTLTNLLRSPHLLHDSPHKWTCTHFPTSDTCLISYSPPILLHRFDALGMLSDGCGSGASTAARWLVISPGAWTGCSTWIRIRRQQKSAAWLLELVSLVWTCPA